MMTPLPRTPTLIDLVVMYLFPIASSGRLFLHLTSHTVIVVPSLRVFMVDRHVTYPLTRVLSTSKLRKERLDSCSGGVVKQSNRYENTDDHGRHAVSSPIYWKRKRI